MIRALTAMEHDRVQGDRFVEFWVSAGGRELLRIAEDLLRENALDSAKAALALNNRVGSGAANEVSAALEIVLARIAASAWGEWTQQGLFSRRSVQQASQPSISAYRAARFAGCRKVLEIGTGPGVDTAALSREAKFIVTLEKDDTVAAMARYNFSLRGIENVQVVNQSFANFLQSSLMSGEFDGLWADPSRRTAGGDRIYDPEEYDPPLSAVMSVPIKEVRGIKISPGINLGRLPSPWVREWLGMRDECLEQVLWRAGGIRDGEAYLADAGQTFIPTGARAESRRWDGITPLKGAFLIEPHAVLIRAGALEEFFAAHEFLFLAPKIAYGVSSSRPSPSPWYALFEILDALPFNERVLKERLAALGWNSRTEIKKRGFPEEPEAIRKKLKLPKPSAAVNDYGVVILTRVGEGHIAILARRIACDRTRRDLN